ncbi:nucleoside/nucleotide kinase family protein [Oryzobacter terrae]|uniref:nucleoside/nucleotide kinase family protein n=1 Tax=Oryzobacter terrae TaxID=1620385 RepID=UPI003670E76E
MTDTPATTATLDQLRRDAEALLADGGSDGDRRVVLGIVGAPASGKSTVAEALVARLGDHAVLVSMDGYHLAHSELTRIGRVERKGAPDTFDAGGFVSLLRRIRADDGTTVYAPEFRREIEDAIASAVPVGPEARLVVVEGNYLLHDDGAWADVLGLLDACWFIDIDEDVRIGRLVTRHMHYGRTEEQARERSLGSDQRNAELIIGTAGRATRVVRIAEDAARA